MGNATAARFGTLCATGGGTYTQVRLPMDVTAAELLVSAKVELLAGNLGRHRHEVWPQREKDTDAVRRGWRSAPTSNLDGPG